jgi:hypothetical protein
MNRVFMASEIKKDEKILLFYTPLYSLLGVAAVIKIDLEQKYPDLIGPTAILERKTRRVGSIRGGLLNRFNNLRKRRK